MSCRVPSFRHDALVEILRRCPELALHLVADRLPASATGQTHRILENELSQVVPPARRPDLVIGVGEPFAAVVIIEVQRSSDRNKRYSFPYYVAALLAEHRCPVLLVVLAASAELARWARRPIDEFQPGHGFVPLVLGPDGLPWIDDPAIALRWPELAALSAMTHGSEPGGIDVVLAALPAFADLGEERASLLWDLVYGCLDEIARAELEERMRTDNYEYKSDFARGYFQKGKEEGREEGRVAGLKLALFALLEARFDRVPEAVRARIDSCNDAETLRRWIPAVAQATTVDEVEAALG